MKLKCNHTYHMSEKPRINSARKPLMNRRKIEKKKQRRRKEQPDQALSSEEDAKGRGAPKSTKETRTRNAKKEKRNSHPSTPASPIPFRPPLLSRANQLFSASHGSELCAAVLPFVIARRKGAVVTQKKSCRRDV